MLGYHGLIVVILQRSVGMCSFRLSRLCVCFSLCLSSVSPLSVVHVFVSRQGMAARFPPASSSPEHTCYHSDNQDSPAAAVFKHRPFHQESSVRLCGNDWHPEESVFLISSMSCQSVSPPACSLSVSFCVDHLDSSLALFFKCSLKPLSFYATPASLVWVQHLGATPSPYSQNFRATIHQFN